ncbi:unnamed protein product [Auanema sp. JU1783]|nr:unnamed protein product [Auanema sp. JU1783]
MSGSWNLNAAEFKPNVNARPFVPGQSYTSEVQASWDAEPEPEPVVVDAAPVAPPPVEEVPNVEEINKNLTETKISEPKVVKDDAPVIVDKKVNRAKLPDANRKEHVNMVFIGHVDAGKSTIGGQLMFLTGMVDKRTLEKYEKEAKDKGRESWYLSWCMDTNDEEREKGKTVECGRAYFETEKKHFTILDAPGHKSFVPNMISGANQADVAVLVISARKGEFETGFDRGGQTREHAMLVKTAGVKHLIILVNKMDDPTVKWDIERFNEIEGKLTPFLRTRGFGKSDITYIPISGLTGAFIKDRPEQNEGAWYTGPCFLEYLDDHLASMSRDFSGAVRCTVVDKYSDMGTLIIGKMESGVVEKGMSLILMPNKTPVQILQIWSDDVETDVVAAGDNIKFKLRGVEEAEIQSGFVLCSQDSLCKVGKIFDAEVVILDYKSIIASGYSCVLHIQAAVEEVAVKVVICTIDKKTGEKKKSRFVKQNEKCIMRLESTEPFCLEPFKEFPQLGRFTLRDEGKTVAIGKVLKIVE